MACCGMEVDPPASVSSTSSLKRSNSAPMINAIGVSSASEPSTVITVTTTSLNSTPASGCSLSMGCLSEPRVRRFSTSSMALHSPTTPVKMRLIQIKQEESLNQVQREAAHEREVQMTQQITRHWDNLLVDEAHERRPKSLGEPLHIQTGLFGHSSSPSPTRGLVKQCFSPSLGLVSPTPSPSPTRKTFRRSASPITLRPSPLGLKRKMDAEWADRSEVPFSSPKRFHASPGGHTPDRLQTHPLVFSTSGDSLPSPAPSPLGGPLPLSSTSTPSPCYMFRTVRDSVESAHGTDSETSDMTEEHPSNSSSSSSAVPMAAEDEDTKPPPTGSSKGS